MGVGILWCCPLAAVSIFWVNITKDMMPAIFPLLCRIEEIIESTCTSDRRQRRTCNYQRQRHIRPLATPNGQVGIAYIYNVVIGQTFRFTLGIRPYRLDWKWLLWVFVLTKSILRNFVCEGDGLGDQHCKPMRRVLLVGPKVHLLHIIAPNSLRENGSTRITLRQSARQSISPSHFC